MKEHKKTIGIVSPCSWMTQEYIDIASSFLENHGFGVKVSQQSFFQTGYTAGSDAQRINAIHEAFMDDEINVVMCAKGGYGAIRIVDNIDFELLNRYPKPFLGYSDATILDIAISLKAPNVPVFFAPHLLDIAYLNGDINHPTLQHLVNFLKGKEDTGVKNNLIKQSIVLKPGKAKGIITGGTLTISLTTLGTSTEVDTNGKILFFEEKKEFAFKVERLLFQLKRAGKLDNIKGVIVGKFYETPEYHIPFDKTMDELVLDIFKDKDIPIISNFPAGHCDIKMPLPFNKEVIIDTEKEIVVSF